MRVLAGLLSVAALLSFQGVAAATEPSDRCVIVDPEEPVRGAACAGQTACAFVPSLPGCITEPHCGPQELVEGLDLSAVTSCLLRPICRLDPSLRPHCERLLDCAALDPLDPRAKECLLDAACQLDPALRSRCDRIVPCTTVDPTDPFPPVPKECLPTAVCLTGPTQPTICIARPF